MTAIGLPDEFTIDLEISKHSLINLQGNCI